MTKKLVVIDGYSLANRAFFALPQLETSDGQPTNAVYGMAMMLLKLLEESDPDYFITAFDVAAPTFRHLEYQAYKAQRLKMEDALKTQFPIIRRLLDILKIPIYEQAGFEADDIIGAIAAKASAQGLHVDIITGDRDSFQLVDANVNVLYTRKGITEVDRVDEAFIQNRYQLPPVRLIELKGLMGDSSDNIPGIPGFGEKTALKYLHQYQTIEGIYQHLDEIVRNRDRQLLTDFKEQAYLSRKLAQIKTDMELDLDLDGCCQHRTFSRAELLEFCVKYQFKSLVKKLAGAGEAIEMVPESPLVEIPFEVELIGDEQLPEVVRLISEEHFCALQFLTITANWHEADWLGLGMASADHNWFYPLDGVMSLPKPLQELLEDETVAKYGYDLKKQLWIAAQKGITVKGFLEDALIAGYLINAGVGGLELDELARIHLRYTVPGWSSERGTKISVFELPALLPVDLTGKIAGGRLECLKHLRAKFNPQLTELQLSDLYYQVELPLIRVLFEMERTGIRVDGAVLRTFGNELKTRQIILETEIYELAGEVFNIGSPKQLGVILFEKLGLKAPKKTKTGYSTDAGVLESLAAHHPVIPKIMEYRQNLKLQSTYIDSLIGLIHPATGRVHTSFNQAVTTTGRLSSTEPNLQNIPIRSEEGKMIRRAFLPADSGYQLLAADYSQIELRVMAHFSKDPAYMDAFLHGKDIHSYTAAAVRGIPLDQVTRQMRDQAKAVNFGIIYGISGFGLANNIGVSRKEADEFIGAYFEKYPGVKQYVAQLIAEARESGSARTLLGRIRKLPDLESRNFTLRAFAERMARNTPIQGTAADIIKVAMVKIAERLDAHPELGKLLLQVHDELIFEVPQERWRDLAVIVKEEMEAAVQLSVPLEVDFKIGSDWGSMTPVRLEDDHAGTTRS